MRPQNRTARDRLAAELRHNSPVAARELADRLLISVPTALRILKERGASVVRIGTTKNARYASRRLLRGSAHPIPVYRIDSQGRGHDVGSLDLLEPNGSVFDLNCMGWPNVPEHANGYWEGLPYPLYDMRPQGFLGRNAARQMCQDLMLPSNINYWHDDDIVYALTQRGSDASGNVIVGERAFDRRQSTVVRPIAPLPEIGLSDNYLKLAVSVTSDGVAGSSAAGEFPKFTAFREFGDATASHVIVKFSGAEDSTTVRRWSDLLVCEHVSLEVVRHATTLSVARSRILQAGGRTFLEVERFDRHGPFGRSELVSLASIDGAFVGSAESNWPESVRQLTKVLSVNPAMQNEVQLLWWYGKLIANSDMHMGNLSFQFTAQPGQNPMLRLAPVYDMLPMFYAPLTGGEVPVRTFEPNLPLPKEREVWRQACHAATEFWQQAGKDARISESFRRVCNENYHGLVDLAQRV